MRPIPKQLRDEMADDPFYKQCCLGDNCYGKIEFHHNLIYAGRQVNEKWAILPLCKFHHDNIAWVRRRVDHIMLNRATDGELRAYSKAIDYVALRERLNKEHEGQS
jgi:hypothetical protein